MRRWRIALAALLGGALLLAFTARPLVQWAGGRLLASQGVEALAIARWRWRLGGVDLTGVELVGAAGGGRYRAAAARLAVRWRSWPPALEVDHLSLEFAAPGAGASPPPLPLARQLEALTALRLPLGALRARGVRLRWSDGGKTLEVNGGDLRVDAHRGALSGRARLLWAAHGRRIPLQVILRPGSEPWLPLLELAPATGRTAATGRLAFHRAEGGWRAAFAFDFPRQSLSPWLAAAGLAAPAEAEGALRLAGSLALPEVLEPHGAGSTLLAALDARGRLALWLPAAGPAVALQLKAPFALAGGWLDLPAPAELTFRLPAGAGSAAARWRAALAPARPWPLGEGAAVELGAALALVAPEAVQSAFSAAVRLAVARTEAGVRLTARGPLTARGRIRPPPALGNGTEEAWSLALALQPSWAVAIARGHVALAAEAAGRAELRGRGVAARLELHLPELEGEGAAWRGRLEGKLALPGSPLPPLAWTAAGRVGETLAVTGELTAPPWGLEGRWRLAGEFARPRLTAQLALELPGVALRALRAHLPAGTSLSAGRGDVRLEIDWRAAPRAVARVDFRQLEGVVAGVPFVGGRLAAALAWRNGCLAADGPWRLAVERLDPGFSIRDLLVEGDLPCVRPGTALAVPLLRARAELFGGRVELAEPGRLGRRSGHLRLAVAGLDLGRLLALYGEDRVWAEGRLDGEIPILWGDAGVRMAGAHFAARPPGGRIALDESLRAALAGAGEELALAARLLSDLRFDALTATADLAPGGELTLTARLSGYNPAEFEGRPVELNLRVEDDLFASWRALRAARRLSEAIEERLSP
ncbi:MAG: hypothetical protein KatS3mg124_2230 [Porticoccaceae bacterium]|nr:MAG: hypothetical protein KatS3mg124_2230 [Porticoccaceae bacterium]